MRPLERIPVSDDSFFLYASAPHERSTKSIVTEAYVVQAARCRSRVERVLPDTAISVYFNLGTTGRRVYNHASDTTLPARAAWVVRPHAESLLVEKEIVDCDIVTLRVPAALSRSVLGVPVLDLVAPMMDLELFWGARAVQSIRDRMDNCTSVGERLAVAEDEMVRRVARARQSSTLNLLDSMTAKLRNTANTITIGELAGMCGISHRKAIALFDEHTGMKPKLWQRVQRMRRALRLLHLDTAPGGAAIGLAAGYYDQAHFISDFRELAGMTPGEYVRARSSVSCGFVPHVLASQA